MPTVGAHRKHVDKKEKKTKRPDRMHPCHNAMRHPSVILTVEIVFHCEMSQCSV